AGVLTRVIGRTRRGLGALRGGMPLLRVRLIGRIGRRSRTARVMPLRRWIPVALLRVLALRRLLLLWWRRPARRMPARGSAVVGLGRPIGRSPVGPVAVRAVRVALLCGGLPTGLRDGCLERRLR